MSLKATIVSGFVTVLLAVMAVVLWTIMLPLIAYFHIREWLYPVRCFFKPDERTLCPSCAKRLKNHKALQRLYYGQMEGEYRCGECECLFVAKFKPREES